MKSLTSQCGSNCIIWMVLLYSKEEEKNTGGDDMNACFSYKMHSMSFLCTCLVAFSHIFGLFYQYSDKGSIGDTVLQRISALVYIAMTYFFFMSAYWLFRMYEPSRFLQILSKRWKSLILPYVIFCFVGYLCAYLTFQPNTSLHPMTIFVAIWNNTWNGALWYMLSLFGFVLLTPLLFLLIKRKYGCLCMIFFLLIFNYYHLPAYESLLFWLPIYLCGGWCSYHFHEWIENKVGKQPAHPLFSILLFLSGIIFLSALGDYTKGDASIFYFVRMSSLPIFLWMIRWLPQHHDLPLIMRQSSFLFYCLHIPLRYFYELVPYIVPITNSLILVLLMLTIFIFMYGFVLLIIYTLKTANPSLLTFVTGGRA